MGSEGGREAGPGTRGRSMSVCTANHMVSVPGHRQWVLPCCFTF